ncbi:MAG: flavin reductase [Bacillota bacterium]|jgi:flavin reductase (DIM6/NTAB) family NADH-FMN oxidoreductase RutF/rubredoxin
MDNKAMFKLSYGLYVVGSALEDKMNAQIANTVFQVNAEPVTVGISLNNNNYTKELVDKSGVFSVNVLSQKANMDIVANFGFKSGRDNDKFEKYNAVAGKTGSPLLNIPEIAATLEAKVIKKMEVGTHTIFVGEVVDAVDLPQTQMTYAEYHKMKNASAAKPAVGAVKKYRCKVCGYIHEGEMPADFKCPLCGVGRDMFEEIAETAPTAEIPKYKCKVCGYIHEGELPADFTCPLCGVGADMFEKI